MNKKILWLIAVTLSWSIFWVLFGILISDLISPDQTTRIMLSRASDITLSVIITLLFLIPINLARQLKVAFSKEPKQKKQTNRSRATKTVKTKTVQNPTYQGGARKLQLVNYKRR